jgi:hypothetical protein
MAAMTWIRLSRNHYFHHYPYVRVLPKPYRALARHLEERPEEGHRLAFDEGYWLTLVVMPGLRRMLLTAGTRMKTGCCCYPHRDLMLPVDLTMKKMKLRET